MKWSKTAGIIFCIYFLSLGSTFLVINFLPFFFLFPFFLPPSLPPPFYFSLFLPSFLPFFLLSLPFLQYGNGAQGLKACQASTLPLEFSHIPLVINFLLRGGFILKSLLNQSCITGLCSNLLYLLRKVFILPSVKLSPSVFFKDFSS
jgi:hypothetical protein